MSRYFGDSTFSAGDPWFCEDDDPRVRAQSMAGTAIILTAEGSMSSSGSGVLRRPRRLTAAELLFLRPRFPVLPPRTY